MLQQDYYFLQINDLINSNQLAIVRWIALAGQLLTVIIVYVGLGYELPLFATLGVILLAAVVNIGHLFYNRNRTRMTNHEAFVLLTFDTLQL